MARGQVKTVVLCTAVTKKVRSKDTPRSTETGTRPLMRAFWVNLSKIVGSKEQEIKKRERMRISRRMEGEREGESADKMAIAAQVTSSPSPDQASPA